MNLAVSLSACAQTFAQHGSKINMTGPLKACVLMPLCFQKEVEELHYALEIEAQQLAAAQQQAAAHAPGQLTHPATGGGTGLRQPDRVAMAIKSAVPFHDNGEHSTCCAICKQMQEHNIY